MTVEPASTSIVMYTGLDKFVLLEQTTSEPTTNVELFVTFMTLLVLNS